MVTIISSPVDFLAEDFEHITELPASVYENRVKLLQAHMQKTGHDFVVIYGDRERFANIEYFTKYDCRFEEGLFILSADGKRTIVVGNEGEGYSYIIPYEIERVRYRHFSLQGQPREGTPTLADVFASVGINKSSKVGFVGNKYFEASECADAAHRYDVPAYMLEELYEVADSTKVDNYTREITGLPNGLRMQIREPAEVAFVEYQSVKSANVIRRLLAAAKPGMSELELAKCAGSDLTPWQMYPLVNLGARSVSLGLKTPVPSSKMELGGVFGLCYSLRGSLCSKVGIAAHSEADVAPELKGKIESFYKNHWFAVARWMETLHVGVTGGELYDAVMDLIGGPEYGVTLNPGHYIAMDEWSNASTYKGSTVPVQSGSMLQTDIIAAHTDPVMTSICEDTVLVADAELQAKLQAETPELYARLTARRQQVRDVLGINLSDDVLPISPLAGVMFPYMLNTAQIYKKA